MVKDGAEREEDKVNPMDQSTQKGNGAFKYMGFTHLPNK